MTSQSAFARALLDSAHPAPEGLTDPKGRPAGKRFDVYRNNVVLSLCDALADAYPVVEKLVGAEFFQAMAGVFVRQYPPQSPILADFAPEFADFLAGFPPVAKLAYLPDIARLERARTEAYHAADASPVGGEALTTLPPAQMAAVRLRLHPSLRLVRSPFPVLAIWQRNSGAPDTPLPEGGQDVLVARPADMVEMRALPPGAVEFLAALRDGNPLGAAVEAGQSARGFDLTANLAGLFAARLLTHIES